MLDPSPFPLLPDPLNRHHPLARGLVSWYLVIPGLAGGKNWYDLVSSNHGALTNMGSGSGWSTTQRPGGWGAMVFDGSNDSVNCGNAPSVGITGSLTLSLWMRLASYPSGAYSLFTKDKDTGGRAFTLDYHNNGSTTRLRWYINGGAGANLIAGSAPLTLGQWYHVVATYAPSGGNLALYLNGLPYVSGSGADSAINTATANLTLGAREYSGNLDNFAGALDGAQLRNRTLTASEAQALYNESRMGYPTLLRRLNRPLSGSALALFRRNLMQRTGSRGSYV